MYGFFAMAKSDLKLILASASPRRKELLGHLKIPFEVIALSVPEHSDATDPVNYTSDIARVKGNAVAAKLFKERSAENFFVVSADTTVIYNGNIYNKPADRNEARKFLSDLSGNTHSVYTAVSLNLLINDKLHHHSFVDESKVTFDKISDVLMERYLDTGDSLDKAGAYGIQGPSLTFISRVDGSYSNVVGFPLSRFVNESQKFLSQHFSGVSSWLELF
jgi:septum formation protein